MFKASQTINSFLLFSLCFMSTGKLTGCQNGLSQGLSKDYSSSSPANIVETKEDVERYKNSQAFLKGTLHQAESQDNIEVGKQFNGFWIALRDGTKVILSYEALPASWKSLIGKKIRLSGLLQHGSQLLDQALVAYHLTGYQTPVQEIVYEELKKWDTSPAGEATLLNLAMPSNFDRTLQGVQMRQVCEFGSYQITAYADRELLFTRFPINEKQRKDLLNVWVITDGERIVCVYKSVREDSTMAPGIYSVNDPSIIKL